jgi:uncharacterized cupredoxin-like copper-binding protein
MRIDGRRLASRAILGSLALGGAACGADASSTDTSSDGGGRVVEIEMVDTAFVPRTITVPSGEEITFELTNTGGSPHDAFIGDERAQAAREQERGGAGTADEEEGDGITVAPGETRTLTHTFDDGGTTIIGCHQPLHYEEGMKVDVTVT